MAKPVKAPIVSSKGEASFRAIVDRTAVMAKTRRLDISFNELLDMYQAEPAELEIRPEFQQQAPLQMSLKLSKDPQKQYKISCRSSFAT